MDHQVAGIRRGNGDVEETNGGGIAELLVGNQLEHRSPTIGPLGSAFVLQGVLLDGKGRHGKGGRRPGNGPMNRNGHPAKVRGTTQTTVG